MNGNSRTLICFAIKEEAGPARAALAENPQVSLLVTGIGRKNARRTLEAEFATQIPGLVITSGFAGALDPKFSIGDVIYEFATEPLCAKLELAGAKPARILCVDRIAVTAADKKQLHDQTGADAVEMESEEIHAACRERGIPCVTVRAISDRADEDLPLDFNQFAKPDMSLDYGKLMRAVAMSPGKISALLRLQKQSKLAAENLSAALARLIA